MGYSDQITPLKRQFTGVFYGLVKLSKNRETHALDKK